ncbi:hypothetical protein FGO68_gene1135 [Halteria grandinella]|uniref:Uncharacterized protein n=1 Tax=Halteria grandinella TaxID=5974 RepID=A0A8J8T067_HALGN|nr:hypothetical protein FGO68_gene1135 [Halteria grandinella]
METLLIVLGLYVLSSKIIPIWEAVKVIFLVRGGVLSKKYPAQNEKSARPWALITGCTAGIGEQITHRLAKEGYNLVLVSRSIQKLEQLRDELSPDIEKKIIQADLCSQATDLHTYQRIAYEVSNLDLAIVINNAGVIYNGYYKDILSAHIREQALVNTYPYLLLTRALLPQLLKRKVQTAIVNLASSASFIPGPYSAQYHCSKAFDRFFSEALASELDGSHIQVTTVCPMYVQTKMISNMKPSWRNGVTSSEEYVEKLFQVLSSGTRVKLFVGPTFHSMETCVNKILMNMVSWYRPTYVMIEKFRKGFIDSEPKN